ncbi:MAG: CocE/NonD family hydrolase [Dehalococcoidales bacterium]|nr:CocE/NonD family hydrolase [Dehalococcoidales bacterium]
MAVKSIKIERDVPMKMRDGVILRADIYRPDDNEKHPAIVARTPYNKLIADDDCLSPMRGAFAGYVFVVQDMRGRFASDGVWGGIGDEGQDGYDTIENVAAEKWCDGNVGMSGCSYLGRNQWQAAVENPPHLKAIAPDIAGSGPLHESRMAGPIDFENMIQWSLGMAVDVLERMRKQGKDVIKAQEMLARALFNLPEVYNYLPVNDTPHFQFEGLKDVYDRITEALPPGCTTDADLWWSYEKITVPCFSGTGWYDINTLGAFTNFEKMRERGGSKVAREGQYLICGPWTHGFRVQAYAGALHFGPAASPVASFTNERRITFFDKYLRGIEAPKPNPPVRYFVMGLNRWHDADTWPLPNTQWQRFFLHSKGHAHTAVGDGVLSRDNPASEAADIFVYDPRFPVPTAGGWLLGGGSLVPGPLEQTFVERRGDVLCYTTPELKQDVEVTGPVKLHLFASTSTRDTDFVAKLCDVHPDGSSYNVVDGWIRAKYRKGIMHPELVEPGKTYEYTIDLAHTSMLFKAGHRIRLVITSSNFPRIDRNMNTGNAFGVDKTGIPAVQTIFHEPDAASYIDLPVIPSGK